MLRGAIDLVNEGQIGGWLYSDVGEVCERTVLAFVDGLCVGSGRVGLLRDDLKAAGLGDGRLGFSFPIAVNDVSDLARVIVKLEGSDFFMLQESATIAKSELFQAPATAPMRIDWMRSKGMLAPVEFTFLKYLQQLGAFDYSLVQPKSGGAARAEISDPLKTALNLFELLLLRGAEVREAGFSTAEYNEIGMRVLAQGGQPLSMVAIWSSTAATVSVIEGSQLENRRMDGFEGAIDYQLGSDRLLFIDLGVQARICVDKPVPLRVFAAY